MTEKEKEDYLQKLREEKKLKGWKSNPAGAFISSLDRSLEKGCCNE